ncbi:anti-sigma factor family protein [Rhodohalobacter barkolensis]|uniref:Uncharacterized protein n=1 Tax=Rhodohalobacter barkolensis TaxID=2053187 RepID=A0A2N0VLI7_9BACT|nr:hypothetical protein [Rhodohalobacter barkolensis]PKD45065.1 hypothetical protein CWD77_06310 [Rhodohalobacter barkolensis]
MSIKKTDSVAYLFNEMDPSEQVEFERKLRENENLLIEVESLRNIRNKFEELPKISAPDRVIQSICERASEQSTSTSITRKKPFYFAAAALLSIGFMAGALVMDSDNSTGDAGAASFGSVGSATGTVQSEGNLDREISPWVDRNDILHFSGIEQESSDSLLKDSYQRLTPVNNRLENSVYQRNLHLTGSRQ